MVQIAIEPKCANYGNTLILTTSQCGKMKNLLSPKKYFAKSTI